MQKQYLILLSLILFLVSCQTTTPEQRYAKIQPVNPEAVNIKVLVDRSIFLDSVSGANDFVFVRVRNTSGEDINLHQRVIQKLKSQGVKVTNDIDKASYVLIANVVTMRYVSAEELTNLQESSYGEDVSNVLNRAIGGAALGGLAGSLDDNSHHTTAGALIGAGIGAAIGLAEANAKAERIARKKAIKYIALTVDIELREKIADDGLVTRRGRQTFADNQSSRGSTNYDRSSPPQERAHFGSSSSVQSEIVENYQEQTHWKRHRTRILVKTKGTKLNFDDVIKRRMTQKLTNSISGFF